MNATISARYLGYSYDRGGGLSKPVFADLVFEIAHGEFLSVVGPNGCGKTTLLKIVGALLKPSSGTVRFKGRPLLRPTRAIGFVFSRPLLVEWRTLRSNLFLPVDLTFKDRGAYASQVDELLELAKLSHVAHRYPTELSTGMQQMASFCMSLVLNPDVLLMDEPFSALDPINRERVWLRFADICSQLQKTVLFVTHSIHEAVFLSDRVLVMPAVSPGQFQDVPIGIPRPRGTDFLRSTAFFEAVDVIHESLMLSRRTPLG